MNTVDISKWIIAIALLLGGLVSFYWYGAESILYRSLGLTAVAAIAVGIAYTTESGKDFVLLFNTARGELRRVVWPTRPETTQTTILVLVFTLIVGIILFLLDTLLNWVFSFFIIV